MSTAPFVNLPHLREKLTPADKSTLRLTPEGLAVWDQRARDAGRPANWRLTDDVREASRHAVLGNWDASEDLCVYAYGSLMWDPGLHFSEVRTAEVEGYQRRFTLKSIGGRGEARRIVRACFSREGADSGCAHSVQQEDGYRYHRAGSALERLTSRAEERQRCGRGSSRSERRRASQEMMRHETQPGAQPDTPGSNFFPAEAPVAACWLAWTLAVTSWPPCSSKGR